MSPDICLLECFCVFVVNNKKDIDFIVIITFFQVQERPIAHNDHEIKGKGKWENESTFFFCIIY